MSKFVSITDWNIPVWGIVADNGYGVYSDREKLNHSLVYLRNYKVKKFDNILDAWEITLKEFEVRLSKQGYKDVKFVGRFMKLNWIFFTKNVIVK